MADWARRTWFLVNSNCRPPLRPRDLAAASPATVRSRMRSPSNSARAAKIPKISFPLDVVVSMLVGALAGEHAQPNATIRERSNGRDQMLEVTSKAIELSYI